jgi:hypothetical protein
LDEDILGIHPEGFIADFKFIIQYFDYPRSRILTNDEYMDEFGGVMKI